MREHEAAVFRDLFGRMARSVRQSILEARKRSDPGDLGRVSHECASDTIFRVDVIAEEAVRRFGDAHWPAGLPVEIVMEGTELGEPITFPGETPVEATRWKCIIDPVDGTRGWMHDKRPAWFLVGVAPQRGDETRLADIEFALMCELPTSKQGFADEICGVRGWGSRGLTAERLSLATGEVISIAARPSGATSFANGFAQLSRFFPPGKSEIAAIEARLWEALLGPAGEGAPLVFEDQYASTGGQIYELLTGRDLMTGDIRPLVLPGLGFGDSLNCHPYDICTAFLLEEAGGVVVDPATGGTVDAPLDTVSPVAWIGFANPDLAALAGPVLRQILRGRSSPE